MASIGGELVQATLRTAHAGIRRPRMRSPSAEEGRGDKKSKHGKEATEEAVEQGESTF